MEASSSLMAGRPDRQLVVKCWFSGKTKRITFASASKCRMTALNARVAEGFALGASSYYIAYEDEEGDENVIGDDGDLTEAIAYYAEGSPDDDINVPPTSSAASVFSYNSINNKKIILKCYVKVEYDGPSLSDTASTIGGRWSDEDYEHGEDDEESSSRSRTSRSLKSGISGQSYPQYSRGGLALGRQPTPADEDYDDDDDRELYVDEDFTDEDGKITGDGNMSSAQSAYTYTDVRYDRPASRNSYDARRIKEPYRSPTHRDSIGSLDPTPNNTRSRASDHGQEYYDGVSLERLPLSHVYDTHQRPGRGPSPAYDDYRQPRPSLSHALREPSRPGPPSFALTSSELGARWLREQEERVMKKIGPGCRSSRSNRDGRVGSSRGDRSVGNCDSVAESFGESDDEISLYEEGRGDLELMRDSKGKWYYSYQTSEMASDATGADDGLQQDSSSGSSRLTRARSARTTCSALSTRTPGALHPPPSQTSIGLAIPNDVPDYHGEPAGPPALAPDCSACGQRLEFMRYVCTICGESHMWLEGEEGKEATLQALRTGEGSSGSSISTRAEWTPINGANSECSELLPSRSIDTTADDVRTAQELHAVTAGSVISMDTPTPPASPRAYHNQIADDEFPLVAGPPKSNKRHGYELCPNCIDVQGIAHSKAMIKEDMEPSAGEVPRSAIRRLNDVRHTYQELMWGAKGWTEIEYNDDCNCSICNVKLFQNRFRCVSCDKFNLCRSCHQNAEEIHPAHCFVAVPDQRKKVEAQVAANGVARTQNAHVNPVKLAKHPGVFCHNCLQDIVGPRFHCAVCPSWDLCIQCEGVTAAITGTGSHTADHIMMKIPLPLATTEVQHVSRRARERWAQQDCTVVGPAGEILSERSRRPPSPTEATVYGGNIPPRQANNAERQTYTDNGNVAVRDKLDHRIQCNGCNEWIKGRRYQCANCPSDPVSYNLCSICEIRSYKLHNPMHVFIKFDRPVHYPLQSPFPVLPPLYKLPVGQVRSTMPLDPSDPTAYLKCVFHPSTLCDIHVGPIQGVWLRCAQCATSFDICQDCESEANHDPTHVFVVFKSEVDMPTFRSLAALSSTHSKPLIHQHVYT